MKKILLSIFITAIVATSVVELSSAFFSDTETSSNNTFTSGAIDLKVDNESYYNGLPNPLTSWSATDLTTHKFFDFNDLKPSDWGEDTISLRVDNNDAWMCADITLTKNDDNGSTEPELLVDDPDNPIDDFDGELAQNINFVFWIDDGDNVLEDNENVFKEGTALTVLNNVTWTLADSITNLFEVTGPLLGSKTYYIGKAWCFGTLTKTPITQGLGVDPTVASGINCNGANLDNSTQTDVLTGDIKFKVEQSRNNPNFLCNPAPSPSPVPTPVISCNENSIIYASSASDNDQGLRKNSTAVLANRSIPSSAFGVPQTTGADSDVGAPVGSFFSLGFPLGGNTASIVFGFAEPFYPNPSGPDLQIFEVTGGVYPDEKVKVEASSTAVGPWTVLSASATRDENIELGILPSAQFVRLTDVSDINLFSGSGDATPDGYDVDALKAFCTVD